MAHVATVEVLVADVEPVSSFIARCCEAANHFYGMTPEQVCALPDECAAGIAVLQSALRDVGRSHEMVHEAP
jgi:hypothetical protein